MSTRVLSTDDRIVRGNQFAAYCADHPNFRISPEIASFLSQFEVRRPEATTQRRTRSTGSTQQLYPPEWVVDVSLVRKELKQFYDTYKSSELKAKKGSDAAIDESLPWSFDEDNNVYDRSVKVINLNAATDESAQPEKMTPGNNCDTDTEDEVDPDDQMIAEGRVKDEALLTQNGFDPIFIEGKYPGEIPAAIAEYLPEDQSKPSWQMVGSNRSIFWIFGYNDVVDVIDDPACLLDDKIVGVPNGVHPVSFLFARYASDDKVPRPLLQKYFDSWAPAPTTAFVMPVFDIPPLASDEPTNHQIRDLYPLGRTRHFPSHLLCLRVKSNKRPEKTRDMVQEKLRDVFDFENDDLWFRGVNLKSLMLSMSFFVPVISTSHSDNEFGPGIYATNDFGEGSKYAQPQGAVMVFKNPDFRDLFVWEPAKDEWSRLTATWLDIQKGNLKVSDSHNDADVIKGPMSSDQHEARKHGRYPSQGEITQITCVSYDSCRALAKSLVAIIYFYR